MPSKVASVIVEAIMMQDRIIQLLVKKQSNEISPAELAELMSLLKSNGRLEERVLQELQSTTYQFINVTDDEIERSVGKLRDGIQQNSKIKQPIVPLFKMIAVAASVLLLLGLGYYLLSYKSAPIAPQASLITTKRGSKSNITLPDGSLVFINAGTRLSYSKSFGDQLREVYLEGEAYFDVIPDASRPFLVRTKNMTVKVVGTSFNVKAYPESDNTETTLIKGIVEVSLARDSTKKIVLRPNEKLTVINEKQPPQQKSGVVAKIIKPTVTITEINKPFGDSVALEVQWTRNRLAFDNMKLGDVAAELSRWYNVSVTVTDDHLRNKEYSGIFEDESIQQVIEALKLTGGFKYKMNKNSITITP